MKPGRGKHASTLDEENQASGHHGLVRPCEMRKGGQILMRSHMRIMLLIARHEQTAPMPRGLMQLSLRSRHP